MGSGNFFLLLLPILLLSGFVLSFNDYKIDKRSQGLSLLDPQEQATSDYSSLFYRFEGQLKSLKLKGWEGQAHVLEKPGWEIPYKFSRLW